MRYYIIAENIEGKRDGFIVSGKNKNEGRINFNKKYPDLLIISIESTTLHEDMLGKSEILGKRR